jgi:hypothetical protein
LPVIAIEESLHLRNGPLLLCHQCLQAHIGFTLAVSAHLRTVTDHLTPPTMRHKNGLINSRRDPQRSPNIHQVSKLRKKASTNDTKRGQRNTPFRSQADISAPSPVAEARNHAIDAQDLRSSRERRNALSHDRKPSHRDMQMPT